MVFLLFSEFENLESRLFANPYLPSPPQFLIENVQIKECKLQDVSAEVYAWMEEYEHVEQQTPFKNLICLSSWSLDIELVSIPRGETCWRLHVYHFSTLNACFLCDQIFLDFLSLRTKNHDFLPPPIFSPLYNS